MQKEYGITCVQSVYELIYFLVIKAEKEMHALNNTFQYQTKHYQKKTQPNERLTKYNVIA